MKIMFVAPGMGYGGAERVMSLLANDFVKKGNEVSMVIMNDNRFLAYELDNSISVTFMETAKFNSIASFPRLIKHLNIIIKEIMPDVILSFINTVVLFSKIATIGLNIPIIFSERNDPYNNIKGIKAKLFQWFSLINSKYIVFQTEEARNYYGSYVKNKSSVILNPFDPTVLPAKKRETEPIIVSVGRLCIQKNQKMQIEAFKMISGTFPEYRLLIYGEGTLREELSNLIVQLHLENRVLLMGNSKNVLVDISGARLFIFTSDFEGLPNALIEAMALGLTCISTDCSPGGARALIENEVNGVLVKCGDTIALKNAIEKLLSDKVLSETYAREAKKIIGKLDLDVIAREWISICEKI